MSVLTGRRQDPDWHVIAGGIGAAVTDTHDDSEDAPWIA
jgi:hypothetical protein